MKDRAIPAPDVRSLARPTCRALIPVLLVLACAGLARADVRYGLGAGWAWDELDKGIAGDKDHGDGFFGFLGGYVDNGVFFRFLASTTDIDGTVLADLGMGPVAVEVDDEVARAELTVGFLFRRDARFRPYIHGGISYLLLDETFMGFKVVEDSSTVLCVGGGAEIGSDRHALLIDFSLEQDHEVDFTVGGSGEFDVRAIHIGYLFRL